MTVVSNTSPISSLATVGRLELLQEIYGLIVIPTAVYSGSQIDVKLPGRSIPIQKLAFGAKRWSQGCYRPYGM